MAQFLETDPSRFIEFRSPNPHFTEQRIDFSLLPFSTREERIIFEREISRSDFQYRANSILSNLGILSGRDPYSSSPTSSKTISFYEVPRQNHDNSKGWYLAEYEKEVGIGKQKRKTWFGIYILLPNGQTTSQHDHPTGVTEDYHRLGGKLTLVVNGQARIMSGADKETVFAGEDHYGITGDQFALMLVVMSGIKDGEERHRNSRRPILPLDPSQS